MDLKRLTVTRVFVSLGLKRYQMKRNEQGYEFIEDNFQKCFIQHGQEDIKNCSLHTMYDPNRIFF